MHFIRKITDLKKSHLFNRICFVALILFSQSVTGENKKNNEFKSDYKLNDSIPKNEFLIGIFWGPVWEHTNDHQYQVIKDANVDYIQNVLSSGLDTEEKNLKMLDLAQKHGLKIYVADPRVKGSDDEIKAMVNTYKTHPATAGYYIQDEPDLKGMDWAADTYKKILSFDHQKVPYVNLLPEWAVKDYEKNYVEQWIAKVGKENLKYLSFDNYPFMVDGSFRVSYFKNLDIIRRAALENKLKTSCYLQSVGIPGAYRRPDEHELRYSAYASVAYGITNIVWFTYWTPTNRGEKFSTAIIDADGNKTDLYDHFKQINGELKQLGKLLVDLDAKAVYHSGTTLPDGIQRLVDGFFWQPVQKSDDMIISHFVNQSSGRNYIMVVNKSVKNQRQFSFKLQNSIKKVLLISKVTDSKSSVTSLKTNYRYKTGIISDTFLPGEGKLYELKAEFESQK